MNERSETVAGYVMDVACVRKYGKSEMAERAARHTRDCALMDHCIDSGYALIDSEGAMSLLEHDATSRVVDAIRSSPRDEGIFLEAERTTEGEEMKTRSVRERILEQDSHAIEQEKPKR